MRFKLQKTLLSTAPQKGSFAISALFLGVLLLVYTWQQNTDWVTENLSANFSDVYTHHHYWKAFTGPLLHANLKHLLSNTLFFTGLAFLLSGYFGWLAFPLLSFFAGGWINFTVLPLYPEHTQVIGASGIVYFMAGFWLALYFSIERGLSNANRLVRVVGVALVLLFPELFEENVSYLSHAVGFFYGVLAGLVYFRIRRSQIRSKEYWLAEETIADFSLGLAESSGDPSDLPERENLTKTTVTDTVTNNGRH